MTPADQENFDALISEFVADSGLEGPLYLITIGANGAVRVTRLSDAGAVEVCASLGVGPAMPIAVTIIDGTGEGRSALITAEAPHTLQ